jgi:hypothetical protein
MEPKNKESNNLNQQNNIPEEFIEREFEEVEDGFYDDRGFYTTPNGSFWDENETYFNRFGFDKHGGRYDKYGVYLPGNNYNFDFNCYEDEIDKKNNENFHQINENTKKELIETYESNNLVVGEIEGLKDDDDDNQENDSDGDYDENDEEMEKIYNECVSISKKKDPIIKNVVNIKLVHDEINTQENQANLNTNN